MDPKLLSELKQLIKGDVATDVKTIEQYSYNASIFKILPQAVVFPKNTDDLKTLVQFTIKHKLAHPALALTARAAGTCMSGGSIGESIIVAFEKYFNHTPKIHGTEAETEPGVMYRNFEHETLKHKLLFPSYPSSREICAMGGIVANNAGGEKSLEFGKTERYVKKLTVILADGKEHVFEPLTQLQLKKKMQQNDFEGQIYKKMFELINTNYEQIMVAKPQVSKNSTGYFLWNVYDKKSGTFDLTKLFIGSQGTLGLFTKTTFQLVPVRRHAEMLIIYLQKLEHLAEIVNIILPLKPESLETYDDHTLRLAVKYFESFAHKLNTTNIFSTAWQFAPELEMQLTNSFPKFTLQVEFTSNSRRELDQKIALLDEMLKPYHEKIKIAPTKKMERKYWLIRRESFNLLRQRVKERYASPFIDDIVVKPEYLPEFLPKLNAILAKYPNLISTVAGHMGDGNFHIIPLINLKDKKQTTVIPKVADEVFSLVLKYKGSISGEHNDGIIRTPFVEKMYGEKMYKLFKETKKIFDPLNIFNPGKKVGGTMEYAMRHIRIEW